MNETARFDVYGKANYSKDGSLVLYDHHEEVVKNLERQLAEAREKIDIHKGNLELAISLSDDSTVILLCTALLEQLKEKGDE